MADEAALFTVPPSEQPLTPTRVRALGDTLKIHFRMRRGGGLDADAVMRLVERFAVEIENRDRSQAADRAAARTAVENLERWQTEYVEEHGVARHPSPAEVTTLMSAQFAADHLLAVGHREVAEVGIPPRPEQTGDLATDVLAEARWLSVALPAAEEHAEVIAAAAPAAEEQVVELRGKSERLAEALPLARSVLPGAEATDDHQVAS